ncbi:MAG: hypothetical protein L0Y71_02760 [Gemmataceae bacterium]|nr:hypothetical protein [Gemmataceae bacterium]
MNAEPPEFNARLLQGSWQVVSVQRDGRMDPTHLGATLSFAGDTVKLEPNSSTRHGLASELVPDRRSVFAASPWESPEQGAPPPIADGTS